MLSGSFRSLAVVITAALLAFTLAACGSDKPDQPKQEKAPKVAEPAETTKEAEQVSYKYAGYGNASKQATKAAPPSC